jgi:uncharacterized RDD family membrane protein YckC
VRSSRDDLIASAGRAGASAAAKLIDGALAAPLPEEIAHSLIDHDVVERVVREVLADVDVESELRRLARDPQVERLLMEAVDSAEAQRLLERLVASPAVRAALVQQTASFSSELAAAVCVRAERLDDDAERTAQRVFGRSPAAGARAYGGAASRAGALALDLSATLAGLAVVAAVLGLIASLAGNLRPGWLGGVLVGAGWLLLVYAYLGFFWTVAGQTPGMRVLRLRVVDSAGNPPSAARSTLRVVALVISIAPCFAGLLPVLFSDRRRGLHDIVAHTTVVRSDAERNVTIP